MALVFLCDHTDIKDEQWGIGMFERRVLRKILGYEREDLRGKT